ncbi:MAG: DnaJ domain-containing protein [bacterium]
MKTIKIFWGVAFISALYMKSGLGMGEYVRKTAPDVNKDQPKFTPRPTKPLPIPQKKQVLQPAAPTESQQRTKPVPPPKPANLSAIPQSIARKPLPVKPSPFDTPMTEKEREAAEKDTDNPFANVQRPTTIVAEKQAPSTPRQLVDTNMDLTKSSAAELKQININAMAEFNAIDAKEPADRTPTEDKRYGELGAFFQRVREEIAKKENAPVPDTATQWQRATPTGIEEKKKADEQAAKAAEQAAKFKEVADRLQPKQPTVWEKIKQGATAVKETLLGRKPTVEISAPTNFRKLSTEEAAAKAQADINAAKAQTANTAAQVKERTAIQKLGTKIIDQINIFTAKISGPRAPTAAEAISIKGAINGFVDSVRNKFATATQPIRRTMSAQLESITRNLNQAIAKIPVSSPQRKQMLSSKFALNHLALNTAKANLDAAKTTAEKLAAAAEYSRALEKMLSSAESRRIGLAEIEAAIKKNNDILSRPHNATTETNVARVTKALQQQRESILTVEASKKEHAALTREFVEGAKKDAAAAAANVAAIEKQQADLSQQAQKLPTSESIEEQRKQLEEGLATARGQLDQVSGSMKESKQEEVAEFERKLAENSELQRQVTDITKQLDEIAPKLEAAKKQQTELADSIKQAEDALKPPATRLKEAQEAIKKSDKAIGGAAKTFKASVQSAFKNLEKAMAGAPKKIRDAATKLNRDLSAKVSKIENSMGKTLDTAIRDFDTFIKKPLAKELSSASKEIQKRINSIITEARKFIGIAQTQNDQRKAAEDASRKAAENAAARERSAEEQRKAEEAEAAKIPKTPEQEVAIKEMQAKIKTLSETQASEINKPFNRDPLKVLGLRENASPQEIKRAYRKLVLLLHPDRNPNLPKYENARVAEYFKAINEAYEKALAKASPTQSTPKQGDVD